MGTDMNTVIVDAAALEPQAALRVSELRYRRLFESAKDGILILDASTGQITDVNPFMVDLLGYSQEEYLGKALWEIGAFKDVAANKSAFLELQKIQYIRYDDLPLTTKDGRQADVEFVSNVYPEGDNEVIQCNIRDISKRKAAAKQLVQAQKMEAVGMLAGGMAHDFNNLLGVIIGNIELLRTRSNLDPDEAQLSLDALDAATRGADLVRGLLAFARRQPLAPRRVEVNELVSGTVNLLRRLLGEAIEISLDLSDSAVWPVLADPALFEASLMNLAINARDAMPRGGRLIIGTSNCRLTAADLARHPQATLPGEYVLIEMRDTGKGISPEVLNRIFEPFFTTKGAGGSTGTGLGLSMVSEFAQQASGFVSVDSDVGVGTTFRLCLPRSTEDVEAAAEPQALAAVADGHETVLAVEDNASMRRVTVRQLAYLGYRALEADNATAALKLLADEKIDLLFTDVVMTGEVNGLELARIALARWPALKVVLTSGFTGDRPDNDAGDLRLLAKPYRVADLAQVLREVLDSSVAKPS
jgi:PAS domain S-box-containing protein